MIPRSHIIEWFHTAPWPTDDQVEQDLVLSRLIVDIANDPLLGEELVFRGGTCLHKLYLPKPWRYSEDLDYVRRTGSPIGPVLDALRHIADLHRFEVRTNVGEVPKLIMRGAFESGARLRVKIEMNTYERSPSRPYRHRDFEVRSAWFDGSGRVLTFDPNELVATKIRALYQRSKGRDLFDLWLALNEIGLSGEEIVSCFEPYRPDRFTRRLAENNLLAKTEDADFRRDLLPLVRAWPELYDIDRAADQILSEVFIHL